MTARECRKFDEALSRGEQAVAALEIHAGSCADCRERLRLWTEISQAAPAMRKAWESPHLLPDIQRALAAAKLPAPAPAAPADDAPRRRFAWIPVAVAASLFVLSMIGLSVLKPGESARDPFARPSMGAEPLMSNRTLKEVEDAETNYLSSIEKLSKLAEPRMANPESSPLLVSYREKLQLLDSAIVDLRGQLEGNRFNTHLRKELLAMYQEKKHTLEEVLKEVKS